MIWVKYMGEINPEAVIKYLYEEYSVWRKLLELAREKEKLLINEDLAGIENITGKEENLVNKARELNAIQEKVMAGYSIEELKKQVDGQYKIKINELQEKLSSLAVEINDQNILNEKLIVNTLQLLNLNLNLVTNNSGQGTYDKKGQLRFKENGLINHKA